MSHPLDFIPASAFKKTFFPLLALTLVLVGVLRLLDAPLRTPAAPNGIVSFELAGTPEKAESILQSWDSRAQLFAAFSLGIDYLFIFAYGLTISLGILMAGTKHGGKFAQLGALLGWGILLAGFLDAIENLALWRILIGAGTDYCPSIAATSATIKFVLILLGLLFALVGWLWRKR